MASNAIPVTGYKGRRHDESLISVVNPSDEYNQTHIEDAAPMTKAEEAVHRETMHTMALAVTAMAKAPPQRPWWVGPVSTVVGVVIAVFGVQFTSVGTSDMKRELALMNQRLEQKEREIAKIADDAKTVQIVWNNVQKNLTIYGILINSETGDVKYSSPRRR